MSEPLPVLLGWRDRVQAVVCHLFGCACRTAAEAAPEGELGPRLKGDGDPSSASAGAAPGAVPNAAPTNPIESGGGGVRRRRSARHRERVGVVARAAPTTLQRNGPAA